MAQDPGTGTGGGGTVNLGGTASSMCAISPSDTVGTIGNLLERIEKLELALSQVLGANLHASTLGDISDQVGWVYGVEYMGVPGWTQTSYGTLIPPPGFTLSGNGFQLYNACTGEYENYQGVVMDENGVLQFGFTDTGNLCGAKVQTWDAAGSGTNVDYAISHYRSSGGSFDLSSGITISASVPSGEGSASFVVSQDGIYLVSATMDAASISGAAGTTNTNFFVKTSNVTNPQTMSDGHTNYTNTFAISGLMRVYASETISLTIDCALTLTGKFCTFSAHRVRGL